MLQHSFKTLAIGIATVMTLTACGGGGSSSTTTTPATNNNSTNNNNTTTPAKATFNQTATWTVDNTTKGTKCYDFDSKAETDCNGNNWDVKFDNTAQRGTASFWSNGGVSGSGKGAVLGLMDWSALKQYTNATTDPASGRDIAMRYQADNASSVFSENTWYAYGANELKLANDHKLYPNNRVYLITTNSADTTSQSTLEAPIYALQIINYYNEAGVSGYPTIRYIDTATPTQVKTETINASSNTAWTFYNLKTGKTVAETEEWHIAFNRMNVKLNGGTSGSGKVAGFLAKTPDGYYDEQKQAIVAKFTTDGKQATLTDLTNTANYAKVTRWVSDKKGSLLNPTYTGTYPNLDYGWYTYNGTNHRLTVKDEATMKGALVRSAEGNSYAKMRLTEIKYPDATSPNILSYTFTFDIQSAQ